MRNPDDSGPIYLPLGMLMDRGPALPARALVIDADADIRRRTAGLLRAEGCEVDEADAGDKALRMTEANDYDIIVSDLWLPGATGIELLDAVRETSPETVFILVTPSPTVETADYTTGSGAGLYLRQPVSHRDLRQAIIRAKRQRARNAAERRDRAILECVEAEVLRNLEAARSFETSLGSVRVAFQPIFQYPEGTIVGHEALLRSSDSAISGPEEMLRRAETQNRVVELGRIVRRQVADALRAGAVERVFVNLHALELTDPELGTEQDPLSEFADRITLELTERMPVETSERMDATLDRLRAKGFAIAIDDLGSGYSSLSSAERVRPDIVKLDASLTRDIHMNDSRRHLVESLIRHYERSSVGVVAEGVEQEDELRTLRSIGCNMVQGFLLGRPKFLAAS